MRFDDRLTTTLDYHVDNQSGWSAQWRQLIDILSHNIDSFDYDILVEGLKRAYFLRDKISISERIESINSIKGRLSSPPLIQFLVNDAPNVAEAAINAACLDEDIWLDLIPEMPIDALILLKKRYLGNEKINVKIDQFLLPLSLSEQDIAPISENEGANRQDALPIAKETIDPLDELKASQKIAKEAAPRAGNNISALVEKIEDYRRDKIQTPISQQPYSDDLLANEMANIDEFKFITDHNGVIIWAEKVPAALIRTLSIAKTAIGDMPGTDGYGAAAFRGRLTIEDARFTFCNSDHQLGGEWFIKAEPFFDKISGRFEGYKGVIKRQKLAEKILTPKYNHAKKDHLQQLAHELRTPLNAIVGFSEIIEQQLFGPVSHDYRSLAGSIYADAQRLLHGLDDLNIAVQLDHGNFDRHSGQCDVDYLLSLLSNRLETLSIAKQVELDLMSIKPMRKMDIDELTAERIFSRLLSAIIIAADNDEKLNGRFRLNSFGYKSIEFTLSLPKKLANLDEAAVWKKLNEDENLTDEAPLLGLGFSLRLVRNLAGNIGGDFKITDNNIILNVPAFLEN
ncbi:hypothetical protein LPB140_07905 [Sphingorhabdus lutea]|uniref:histidine kinase n=1 Tax=Sphingorhabdus lutea TaxID=1913578 RepID=A0A1L3JC68_9SPHN|nr:histidine kinase dimerization/phospho-acceptor domain-containing protein [Sphingorhabdus lutea]APG62724.1 hypothetical protein LPB140_07905 [Sphingorhabdus lutea]